MNLSTSRRTADSLTMVCKYAKNVDMEEDISKEIREIISDIQCQHGLCCLETGHDKACKATDVGLKEYIKCLEEDASLCQFSVSFGSHYFCSCPLRVNICRNLRKEKWGSYLKH